MITLHFLDGTPIYLQPDRIESVFETEGVIDEEVYTLVMMFTGESWRVKESATDVLLVRRAHLGLREPALENVEDDIMWERVKVGGTD